jgi:polygalacturonase
MENHGRRSFLSYAAYGVGGGAIFATGRAGFAQAANGMVARGVLNVKEFGATGDGKTIDTPAINRAIEAAAASGGGTVRFPGGSYLSYSIHLKSNVALFLETGATIIAAPDRSQGGPGNYDAPEPNQWEAYQDFGHNHWHNSLIWGENVENIAILGPGTIWGKGLSKGYGPGPKAEQEGVGNKSVALKNCHNVTLRDFSILHGGWFGILATGVNNLTIDNLKIDTNRDGMDIDCCSNVRVSNCSVNSPWDDGICLKSSYALGAPVSTDMVTITNCLVSGSFVEGTLLDGTYKRYPADTRIPRTGRIKFGTESNGGFRNITISNCVFDGCQGLALETVDGALLEDVAITNITMRDISSAPLFMRLGRRMRGPADRQIGALRRVLISGIVCSNSASRIASVISGIPDHSIEDVKIDRIYIQTRGGETPQGEPPEQETAYPEPGRFHPMPASGFYIRHVKNIEMSNIELAFIAPDQRPPFFLNGVDGADFFRIKVPQVANVPMFSLNNVSDFSVARSKPAPDTAVQHVDHKEL